METHTLQDAFQCVYSTEKKHLAPTQGSVSRVIVIGAGIAGLSAASALHAAGVEVVVLEGRARIGGRTHTIRISETDVDMGAAWIHSPIGNPLLALLQSLNIELRPFGLDVIFDTMRLVGKGGEILSKRNRAAAMKLTNAVEADVMDAAAGLTTPRPLADLIETRLQSVQDMALRAWVRFILHTGFQADLASSVEQISTDNYAVESGFSGDDHVLVGGYKILVSRLAKELRVHCNANVEHVEQTPTGVVVRCSDGRVEVGSHALVAVPLGVLKTDTIQFSPPLPQAKVTAIKRLGVGIFEKLVLQFESAFWRESTLDPCGFLVQDNPVLPYWIDLGTETEKPTLVAHATGPAGAAFAQLDDAAALALACKLLASIFVNGYADPVSMHRSNWSGDPFSRGAYLHLTPESSAYDIEALGAPTGRLLFAGEATSPQRFGYVDGAYATGLREAKRLLGSMEKCGYPS